MEDGLKSDLFKLEDLNNIPILKFIITKHKKKLKKYSIDLVIRQIIREMINEMVNDLIKTTKRNIKKNNLKNLSDVYKSKYPIVQFSEKMENFDKKIKIFLRKKMYYHKNVKKKQKMVKKLSINYFLR